MPVFRVLAARPPRLARGRAGHVSRRSGRAGRSERRNEHRRQRGPAAAGRPLGTARHDRGKLDLAGRESRRRDHRLRLPRRPVHDTHRRGHGDAAHLGHGLRRAAAVLPRRFAHRVHVGRRRRPEHLDPLPRRLGDEADLEGRRQPRRITRVDAGRRLRRRRDGRLPGPRAAEAQAVPRRGRQRDPAGVRARQSEDGRTGGVARRSLHLVLAAHRRLDLQRAVPAVPARGLRHRKRRALHAVVALRLGHSAHPVARRTLARLRHPARRSHRARAAGSGVGRGALARLPGAARRPGIAGDAGRAAGHVVHPRLRPPGRLLRRQDLEAAGRGRQGGGDPVPRAVRPRTRAAGGLRLPHRGHAYLQGPPDPRRGAFPERRPSGVHGPRSIVGVRGGRLEPRACHRGRHVGALRGVVPGRRLDRLFHLGRRRRPPLQGARRRQRRPRAPDPQRRRVLRAGVGAGGQHRGPAGAGPRLRDAGRGRRPGHRDRLGVGEPRGRRGRAGDARRAHRRAREPALRRGFRPHPPVPGARHADLDALGRDGREGAPGGARPHRQRLRRGPAPDHHRDGAARRPGAGGDPAADLHGHRSTRRSDADHRPVQSRQRRLPFPSGHEHRRRVPGLGRRRPDRALVAGKRALRLRPRRGAGLRGARGGSGRRRGGSG